MLSDPARRVLDLARGDRAAATAELESLSAPAQADLVCSAPLARRYEILGLLETPEAVIPLIPEAELCFIAKAIGIGDASWLLEYASPEQVVACIDLDIWRGTTPDRDALDSWLDALSTGSGAAFLRSVRALDPEVVVLFLKHRIQCIQKPSDDDDWEEPDGGQTLDGQFYFIPFRPDDDITAVVSMLKGLFVEEYWTYFRMMLGVIHELDSDNEEWALRWKSARLEDLGFPPWERAMRIYAFIRPGNRAQIAPDVDALDVGEWQLPTTMPAPAVSADHEHLLFRVFAGLDEARRRAALFGCIALANKVAVADRMELGDAESTPLAIEKAARFASDGLAYIANETGLDPVAIVERVPLERLFGVGANLDPDAAKPGVG